MTTPAWYSDVMNTVADASYSGGPAAFDELSPGERISPSSGRAASGSALRGILLLIVALGGGWATIGDRAAVEEWVSAIMATSAPPPAAVLPASPEGASTLAPLPPSIEPAPEPKLAAVVIPPPAPSTAAKASAPPAPNDAETDADAAPEPLPPPTANPADPYEVRALSVGLHPGLSRVLLTRMSDTDYRNAGMAIDKAIAETPSGSVFVWPRQRKPELALFHVSFVRGAASNCRRYVVVVTKDGWSTTALPMERCGPHIRAPAR